MSYAMPQPTKLPVPSMNAHQSISARHLRDRHWRPIMLGLHDPICFPADEPPCFAASHGTSTKPHARRRS